MTQKEFTDRTKVAISIEEFEVINEFYMNCECDKDEFCKMWCKMNPSRVKGAKVEKMLKEKDEAYRDALYKFYDKTSRYNLFVKISDVKISAYEVQALRYADIKIEDDKSLWSIRYEIAKYLKICLY